ncbi:uncharacterized protein LOC129720577 [Wyeomyia smithii]|uniref:uncharacterized protein LOC129720577 n=1 Tax=Wyeomyia smithii TaxID=174621 RepID=UPI00246801A5|nr:uncharacterized protein LOC129720577 [Wyeomyia smithii]
MASGFTPGLMEATIPPDLNAATKWSNTTTIGSRTVDGSVANRRLPEWMDPNNGELTILSMKATKGELPDNPFLIKKSVELVAGNIEDARPETRGSRYILKVRQTKQVKTLLELTKLIDGTEVVVEFHQTLNIQKCIVTCSYGIKMADDELLEELRPQRVLEIKRFTTWDKKKNTRIPTPTMIVTFQGTTIPQFVYFGYVRAKTRPYYPSPLQCGNCHRFGHTKRNCQAKSICPICSQEHEQAVPCSADAHCVNCNGAHSARARECAIKMAETAIVHIKVDEDVSFAEARRRYGAQQKIAPAENNRVQHRFELAKNSMYTDMMKKLEAKDEEITKLRGLLERMIREVAELKKFKTAASISNKPEATVQQNSNLDSALIPRMEVDNKTDAKSMKRRQDNSTPSSPRMLSPPQKKYVENSKNHDDGKFPSPPPSSSVVYSRTCVSPTLEDQSV